MRLPKVILSRPTISIRLRLTIWYSLLLGVTLLLFASFVYVTLARNLGAELDRSIAERAVDVNRAIHVQISPSLVTIIPPPPNDYAAADIFVQIADLDGNVVSSSSNLGNRPLPVDQADLEAAQVGESRYYTLEVSGERIRVFAVPLIIGSGQVVGLLQVARSLQEMENTLASLQLLLLAGIGASVLLSVLVGWALARAALAPIEQVTQAAKEIGDRRDFSRRVVYPGPTDEVGRLAATFNVMLGRLQATYAELQGAYGRIEETLAAQRRFVADASHELRTPLTTIRGNAALLRQVEMSPIDQEASLVQILDEAERMSRLVQELLTLARADAGQDLASEPVELGPLVREVYRQATVMASGSGGADVRLAEVAEVTVLGDRDHLKQLLLILVENSLKFTPAGEVRIGVSVEAGEARLVVSDTGVGIAPDDLPHIFERFYRADQARGSSGTGLGLAIARWITEQHRGKIEVASEPGRGSAFLVRLAAISPAEEPIRPESPVAVAGRSAPPLPPASGG